MLIRRLVPLDAAAYQTLRLAALRECPSAFSASFDEECGTPLATIEGYLAANSGRNMFGVFDGAMLAGMVGVGRELAPKLRHKAFIRGMVVAPSYRSQGLGRQLIGHALAFAQSMQELRQVTLTVTADNAAAVALYASVGFTAFGREPHALFVDGAYFEDIHMVRNVDQHPSCVAQTGR